MERLGGLDAAFLALETPTSHLHLLAVLVFEPPPPGHPPLAVAVRRIVEERLHLVPFLRRRAVPVPFGLGHPVWVEDAGFDLDYHLRRASLPAPGGPAELASFVGDLAGRPLDRRRPLWELHVVEGLEAGAEAVVAKVHHAAVDGESGAELLATLLDDRPLGRVVPPPPRPWRPEPVPNPAELVGAAVGSLLGRGGQAAAATLRTVGGVLADAERAAGGPGRCPTPPRTSFNAAVTPQRRVAWVSVPLDQLRAVATAAGGRVNDVVLAAVSGALRRWLEGRGERCGEDLVAMVPVSTRRPGADGPGANRLTARFVTLPVTVEDPRSCLRLVAESTASWPSGQGVVSEDLLGRLAELAVPALSARAARLAGNLGLFDRVPPPCNLVVSNIRGPAERLWCDGRRLVELVPSGPVVDGVGLNVTCLSYAGQMAFGLTACRDLVPDLAELAGALGDAVAELVKAVAAEGRGRRLLH